jgi:endonuclease YncB( thermonuclease family)
MKSLNILIFLLIFNTFILLGFLASEFTGKVTYERMSVNVTRIVDGDTIDVTSNNLTQRLRLLGINTPEKKNPGYEEAKDYLMQYEGKIIEIEDRGKDKYQRTLAYIHYNNQLINAEILKSGLANLYVYEKDGNYEKLKSAEEKARNNNLGLWKKSGNYGCIELINLKYYEGGERCTNNEQLILNNKCKEMSIILKDDANHIEKFNLTAGAFTKNFSCVWNDEGDSLYIRDNSGLLLFYRY